MRAKKPFLRPLIYLKISDGLNWSHSAVCCFLSIWAAFWFIKQGPIWYDSDMILCKRESQKWVVKFIFFLNFLFFLNEKSDNQTPPFFLIKKEIVENIAWAPAILQSLEGKNGLEKAFFFTFTPRFPPFSRFRLILRRKKAKNCYGKRFRLFRV